MVDRHPRLWNLADGSLRKKLDPTPDDIYSVTLSPDGKIAATSGYGGYLTLWDLAEGKPLKAWKLPKFGAYCVKFAPEGKQILTGHDNGMIYVTPLE